MATLAAQITPAGIAAPQFPDVLAELQNAYRSIYGADAELEPNDQDGQFLAVLAQAIADTNNMAVAVYNAFSPANAQGVGLASIVKINGLTKHVPTFSTSPLTIVGQVNTVINGGIVGDNANLGTQWALPDTVTIPAAGTLDVTVTCTVAGATPAGAGTLTRIVTPTAGWQTATNAIAATPGAPVEIDAALRIRQSKSTSLPANTVLDAIYAAVANVNGVTEAAIFENFTETTNAIGLPAHSIAVVALGGTATDIAQAILNKKTPGTTTFGTTSAIVFDQLGVPNTINFFRLTQPPMIVLVTIKALNGFLATTGATIQQSVAAFVNQLDEGETSYLARLYAPANLSGDAATGASGQTQQQLDALAKTFTVTAITQARDANPPAAADVAFAFSEQGKIALGNVTVTIT